MPEQVPISGTGEQRIVVGTDGPPCASRAVDLAAHEAARPDALLHMVASVCEYVLHHASSTTIEDR
jgi:hypothetical protein